MITELNEIKHRKITEKDINNNKNTPKDFNILNDFLKANQEKEDGDGCDIAEISFENYCNNVCLQFNNVKNYNALIRILNGEYLNKWRPLYQRLLLSSKINMDDNPELSKRLKSDAEWLKLNSKELILFNNKNMHDKCSPSLKNLKNYKVCMSEKYNPLKNIILPQKNTNKSLV